MVRLPPEALPSEKRATSVARRLAAEVMLLAEAVASSTIAAFCWVARSIEPTAALTSVMPCACVSEALAMSAMRPLMSPIFCAIR